MQWGKAYADYPYLKRLKIAADATYQQIEEVLAAAFIKALDYSGEIIALEPYTMSKLFTEVWEEHSEVLTDLLAQLVAMEEKYVNGIITLEDRKEDLIQYYEAAGFGNFQTTLDAMSAEEIEALYERTFDEI